MSTPIEAHLDLALQIAEAISRSGNVVAARLIAESEAQAVAAKVSSLTCTHHNDQQRAACPVCLVTALTAERDQLRQQVANLTYSNNAHRETAETWRAAAIERDQLRAEVECLRAGIEECLHTNAHLADGEDCTLIGLKRCLRDPAATRESNGGAA